MVGARDVDGGRERAMCGDSSSVDAWQAGTRNGRTDTDTQLQQLPCHLPWISFPTFCPLASTYYSTQLSSLLHFSRASLSLTLLLTGLSLQLTSHALYPSLVSIFLPENCHQPGYPHLASAELLLVPAENRNPLYSICRNILDPHAELIAQ